MEQPSVERCNDCSSQHHHQEWPQRCATNRHLCSVVASQPILPADQAGHYEEGLQCHIGIKLSAEEHPTKQQAANNTDPPGVYAVDSGEQDGGSVEDVSRCFHALIHALPLRSRSGSGSRESRHSLGIESRPTANATIPPTIAAFVSQSPPAEIVTVRAST